jgi:hypothetical protein
MYMNAFWLGNNFQIANFRLDDYAAKPGFVVVFTCICRNAADSHEQCKQSATKVKYLSHGENTFQESKKQLIKKDWACLHRKPPRKKYKQKLKAFIA